MVFVDERPLGRIQGMSVRMLVDPEKLSVAREILDESKRRHYHSGDGNRAQEPLHIGNSSQTLYRHQEQQRVRDKHGKTGLCRTWRHADLVPNAQDTWQIC